MVVCRDYEQPPQSGRLSSHCRTAKWLFLSSSQLRSIPPRFWTSFDPCRWAFLLGSERGFGAAKWRLKANRQSIPVDLAVKPEIRSRSLHDFGLRLDWLLCNDFGEEFT